MARSRKKAATGVSVTGKPELKRAQSKRPSQRSSTYRGVTRHRWTGRFEAHLWDKDVCNGAIKKKGKQVYLGGYDDEEAAARTYDLAALKYWGPGAVLNFPLCAYSEELREMEGQPREDYIGSLRRRSSGFSRGVSMYRGVARHHHNGRWEARIGRVLGNKYLYLGTYATQEEAAVAYDIAAIEHRGLNAVTNFDINHYINHWRRHCHGPSNDSLGAMDDIVVASIIPFQLPDDLPECPDAISIEGTAGDAELHNGEGLHQHHTSGQLFHAQQQFPDEMGASAPSHQMAPKSSVLDMVLQSPKFVELMEQVTAAVPASESSSSFSSISTSLPSPALSSFSPLPDLQLPSPSLSAFSPSPDLELPSASLSSFSPSPDLELPLPSTLPTFSPSQDGQLLSPPPQMQQQEEPEFLVEDAPARYSFPDDVQTYFDFENQDDLSFLYTEVDTFLFGDLGAYAAPIFHFDSDV